MSNDNDLPSFNKLQWACRRGMLELDVLLGNFLREKYPDLPLEDQRTFVILLTYTDPELFAWLIEKAHPTEPVLGRMIEQIRHHARTRLQP